MPKKFKHLVTSTTGPPQRREKLAPPQMAKQYHFEPPNGSKVKILFMWTNKKRDLGGLRSA